MNIFLTGSWNYIVLSFVPLEPNTAMVEGSGSAPLMTSDIVEPNTMVTVHINDAFVEECSLPKELPDTIQSIILGEEYSGFLQDVGIDPRPVNESDIETSFGNVSFIPQCLCSAGSDVSFDEQFCVGSDNEPITR